MITPNKRTILLSFEISPKETWYEKIKSGEKIFEYRKVFPKEAVRAYIYATAPIKGIVAYMDLGPREDLKDWLEQYSYDSNTAERIKGFMEDCRYAAPVYEFQEIEKLPLADLRKVQGFVAPRMYYYIDDSPLLSYIEVNTVSIGELRINNFDNLSLEDIC